MSSTFSVIDVPFLGLHSLTLGVMVRMSLLGVIRGLPVFCLSLTSPVWQYLVIRSQNVWSVTLNVAATTAGVLPACLPISNGNNVLCKLVNCHTRCVWLYFLPVLHYDYYSSSHSSSHYSSYHDHVIFKPAPHFKSLQLHQSIFSSLPILAAGCSGRLHTCKCIYIFIYIYLSQSLPVLAAHLPTHSFV